MKQNVLQVGGGRSSFMLSGMPPSNLYSRTDPINLGGLTVLNARCYSVVVVYLCIDAKAGGRSLLLRTTFSYLVYVLAELCGLEICPCTCACPHRKVQVEDPMAAPGPDTTFKVGPNAWKFDAFLLYFSSPMLEWIW